MLDAIIIGAVGIIVADLIAIRFALRRIEKRLGPPPPSDD